MLILGQLFFKIKRETNEYEKYPYQNNKGRFSKPFRIGQHDKAIHPTEIAQILHSLPIVTAVNGFPTLPVYQQVKFFSYLDMPLQKKIIRTVKKGAEIVKFANKMAFRWVKCYSGKDNKIL